METVADGEVKRLTGRASWTTQKTSDNASRAAVEEMRQIDLEEIDKIATVQVNLAMDFAMRDSYLAPPIDDQREDDLSNRRTGRGNSRRSDRRQERNSEDRCRKAGREKHRHPLRDLSDSFSSSDESSSGGSETTSKASGASRTDPTINCKTVESRLKRKNLEARPFEGNQANPQGLYGSVWLQEKPTDWQISHLFARRKENDRLM